MVESAAVIPDKSAKPMRSNPSLLFTVLFLVTCQSGHGSVPSYRTDKHPENIIPKNPKVRELLRQELQAESTNDLKGAIELNKNIIAIETDNVLSMNTIGGLYGKLGQFKDEIIWSRKAIAVNPNFALAYVNEGSAFAGLGELAEAKNAFLKASTLDPKSVFPIYSLGVIEENEKNYTKAAELYQNSIQLDPKFENGYFNLAAVYANLKEYGKAEVALKQLLKINPKDTDAQEMLKQITQKAADLKAKHQ